MKQLLLSVMILIGVLTASADITTMTFKTADGQERVIEAEGLVITFNNGFLTATNPQHSLSLPLSDLYTMQFSDNLVGMESINGVSFTGTFSVYSIDGCIVGTFESQSQLYDTLPAGMYVVKQSNGTTSKITIVK